MAIRPEFLEGLNIGQPTKQGGIETTKLTEPQGKVRPEFLSGLFVNGEKQPEISATLPAGMPLDVPYQEVLAQPAPLEGAGAPPEPTIGEKLYGTYEAGKSILSGMTKGVLAANRAFVTNILDEVKSGKFGTEEAADRIEQATFNAMQQATSQPTIPYGQEVTSAIGQVMEQAVPVAPVAGALGAEAALARGGAGMALKGPRAAARQAIEQPVTKITPAKYKPQVAETLDTAGEKLTNLLPKRETEAVRAESQVGAAATQEEQMKVQRAESLPVPVKLTKGERMGGPGAFEQRQFEAEARKAQRGEKLRLQRAETNKKLYQNLDSFIDRTGAEETELRNIGVAIDKPLVNLMKRDKAKIKAFYKRARKSGEMKEKTTLDSLTGMLNGSKDEAAVVDILKFAKNKGKTLGIFKEDENGKLIPNKASLGKIEFFRQAINKAVSKNDPREITWSSTIRKLIDDGTEGKGGQYYKKGRASRRQFAQDFEDFALIKSLTSKKKIGSEERKVALEDSLDRIVFSKATSLDALKQFHKTLTRPETGEQGKQAWAEIQGGTLAKIRDNSFKGQKTDVYGNKLISPAQLEKSIRDLDNTGKLDFIFSKNGAQDLRDFVDTVVDIMKDMEGTVNYSNTSSSVIKAFNALISGVSKAPIIGKFPAYFLQKGKEYAENAAFDARIEEALK